MKTATGRLTVLILILSLSLPNPGGEWLANSASASEASQHSESAPLEPGVHIVSSDETGIVLELYTPDFQVELLATEEITCDQLGVADYATNDQTGWPALPVRGAMLGIPSNADVTLTVLEVDAEVLPESYDLCPVPSPIVETEPTGEIRYGGTALIQDDQAYATDALWPATPAEMVETGFIRSQRVAQVRFHPFQYNAAAGTLRHLKRIRVRLDFNRDGTFALDATPIDIINEGAFEETLSHALINYDTARQWRTRPALPGHLDTLPSQTGPSYKISVDEDGIYEVAYADLQAAGVETATLNALDPHTFQLHNQGQEVAIYVTGAGDDSFDPGDAVLFYGQGMNTKYTDVNVYWLTWGESQGIRMPEVDGTPVEAASVLTYYLTTRHLEENHLYLSKYPSGNADHWYWNFVYKDVYDSQVYTTTLHNVATVPFSATIRGLFRGLHAEPPFHSVQVSLNGHSIYTVTWNAGYEHAFEVNVPQSYINEGTNTITVVGGVGTVIDIFYINWFEIEYYTTYTTDEDQLFFDGDQAGTWLYQATGFTTDTLDVFDITAPVSPTRIVSATVQGSGAYTLTFQHTITEEHHYLALSPPQRLDPLGIERDTPSDLYSSANSADYIIVTHGDFYTDVQQLAVYNTITRGLRTAIADVQDVYDEFSYGIFDPEAIRDFLAYAYVNWTAPAPTYVLLVGDGNVDFKDHFGYDEPNYIPPYLADVDPWKGEIAADNRYVCVSGGDILPDMHLGRLPVRNSFEASTMVTKILEYEQNPPGGDWNQHALFVSDDADEAGNFYAYSDTLIEGYLPAPYLPQKVYYKLTHPTDTGARQAIIDAINEGQLLVNYIGHGNYYKWAYEQLLGVQYAPQLTNGGKLPLMVPMTCDEGNFVIPSPPGQNRSSLGESVVRASGGGAIASWSPTGWGLVEGHDYLNRELFEAIFFDGVVQLGPATLQSKLYLYGSTGGHRELIDSYTLFGDPALQLNVLTADVEIAKAADPAGIVQAGNVVTYTLTYSNTGPATAHHVVITDTLPAALLDPAVTYTGATIASRLGSRFVWDVDDLAAGEGGVITIAATVALTATHTLSNTATIAATVIESDPNDNVATTTINVTIHRYYFPIVALQSAFDEP